ncbi:MAG: hypothetical protein B6D44_14470 [Ignavibacteriales bacterium UTCHB2]|nr:MAG: hypothetical protein BWY38_01526 [Ignavibacteria bacterium ADurb.Bin266]OQY70912.1 MAG: hypothetical protein B6D44_14470 [Ignavibacteriales bacterium UTCHB2]
MNNFDSQGDNLPGPFAILFLIVMCVVVAFLDLGNKWYEIIIRIIAFLFALSFSFILYAFVTNIVASSHSRFKRFFHTILLLIFPIIIYLALKIYLL